MIRRVERGMGVAVLRELLILLRSMIMTRLHYQVCEQKRGLLRAADAFECETHLMGK
jgi:hypothetical protein